MSVAAPASIPDLEGQDAQAVLARMVSNHHPALAMACSFQKEEAVLLDMLLAIEPGARVFTIDTGVLFDETRAAWREVERRYGLQVEVYDALSPDGTPWTAQRCCSDAKVAALGQALDGLEGWITGMRREQAPTRAAAPKLDWDAAHGLWKANPLADWTDKQVWSYIAEHDLPYNALHDQGYSSIGCAPCTQPGSGREGRWAGEDKTECGIHVAEG
ncbi:MAG TPA: phosphoadenylyl-sulfate reductase [Solirubrobacteraceae bacterium]